MRKSFDTKVEKLHVKGNSDGSQPLVLWWNRQISARKMKYSGDGRDESLDAAGRSCRVFPNAFSVSSRGHYADPNLGAQVRLLTAGFHLMQGYFRDDEPLGTLVLDESAKAELDSLWQNLNFVTLVPLRQYKDFLFFERAESPNLRVEPEFDFTRPSKDVISDVKLKRMCAHMSRTLYQRPTMAISDRYHQYLFRTSWSLDEKSLVPAATWNRCRSSPNDTQTAVICRAR